MGRLTWGFTSSLDGFITGPDHDMSWMSGLGSPADDTVEDLAAQVAVIISGRSGYDAAKAQADERDELTAEALDRGLDIVHPLTTEDWGIRRFFVRDPDGSIINVAQHRG